MPVWRKTICDLKLMELLPAKKKRVIMDCVEGENKFMQKNIVSSRNEDKLATGTENHGKRASGKKKAWLVRNNMHLSSRWLLTRVTFHVLCCTYMSY